MPLLTLIERAMQTTDQSLDVAVSPATTQDIDAHLTPEEADAILQQAEAEIQPLLRKMRKDRFTGWIQGVVCVSLILFSMGGIVWQCITYPHMLVVLFTKAKPASITAMLDVPTRTLAPVTITRSATTATTGTGHQDARAASGILTFYNGQLQSITVPNGSVFTTRDGEQIVTTQDAVIPAADPSTTPPTYGQATVYAQAVHTGASGNIAAFGISGPCCAPSVVIKNLTSFHNGQDARSYKAVAQLDIQSLTATTNQKANRDIPQAFSLRPGELVQPTNCTTKTTANHAPGDEATSVTVTTVKTCSAIAYNQDELTREATAAFTKTRPAAPYHLVGNVQTSVKSVSPLFVTLSGKWAYTFSQDYKHLLAEKIEGDSPAKARASLLKTGVVTYANVPSTLPAAMYINFLVLVA